MSDPDVVAEGLGFTFPGRDCATLHDVSFRLTPGTWTLLAGRTGSGKTTLLRALAGLIPHHTAGTMAGRVVVCGCDTRETTPAAMAGHVGLVQQSPDDQICTTTVEAETAFGLENLALPHAEIGRRTAEALNRAGLERLRNARTHQLSGGEKQRLVLAGILAMQPRLLLLDEPFSQLDPQGAADLLDRLEALRAAGVTLVVVEHRLDELLPRADRVLVLDRGRLVADLAAGEPDRLASTFAACRLELPDVTQLALQTGRGPLQTVEQFAAVLAPSHGSRPASPPPVPAAHQDSILHVEDLAYRFSGAAQPLWTDVNFDLYAGQRVALVGPNGSGKSTLLAVLAGLLAATGGTVDSPGMKGASPRRHRPSCGLVLQNPDLMLFCRSVRAELAFGPQRAGLTPAQIDQRVHSAAATLSISDLLDESPLALSRGQRLRAAMAAALAMQPELLLLDEPTTAQDHRQVLDVLESLRRACEDGQVRCLLFSTHDLKSAVRFADRVLVLADGRLLADCLPADLLADEDLLRAARLKRPPLLEVRHRLGLAGLTLEEMAQELAI